MTVLKFFILLYSFFFISLGLISKPAVGNDLDKTLKTAYEVLKPERYCIINIADIKVGQKNFYPLEKRPPIICREEQCILSHLFI